MCQRLANCLILPSGVYNLSERGKQTMSGYLRLQSQYQLERLQPLLEQMCAEADVRLENHVGQPVSLGWGASQVDFVVRGSQFPGGSCHDIGWRVGADGGASVYDMDRGRANYKFAADVDVAYKVAEVEEALLGNPLFSLASVQKQEQPGGVLSLEIEGFDVPGGSQEAVRVGGDESWLL